MVKTLSFQDTRSFKSVFWMWIFPFLVLHTGSWGSILFQHTAGSTLWYLPVPFGIILIHLFGPRVLPAVFLNAITMAGLLGISPWYAWPVYAIPDVFTVFLSWMFFSRLYKGNHRIPDVRSLVSFLLLGIIAPVSIGASLLHGMLYLTGVIPERIFLQEILVALVANIQTCIAVCTPGLAGASIFFSSSNKKNKVPGYNILPDNSNKALAICEMVFLLISSTIITNTFDVYGSFYFYSFFLIWSAVRLGSLTTMILYLYIVFINIIIPTVFRGFSPEELRNTTYVTTINANLLLIGLIMLVTSRSIDDLKSEIKRRKIAEESLSVSERSFREIFQHNPVAIWVENLSGVFAIISKHLPYIANDDRGAFLKANPDILIDCMKAIKVININQATLDLYGAKDKKTLLAELPNTYIDETFETLKEHLQASIDIKKDMTSDSRIRRLDGSIRNVTIHWTAIGNKPDAYNYVIVSMLDITDRKRIEETAKSNLREKETLLRELYHRTKNNMQIIVSLLNLQAAISKSAEVTASLQEAQERILSMSLVHEKLYQSQNLTSVNLDEYIEDLYKRILETNLSSGTAVESGLSLDPVSVRIETAIPAGLVINEIITNIFKHAFPDKKGKIEIYLHNINNTHIKLVISDNGKGLPENYDIMKASTLGMQTAYNIINNQLSGSMSATSANGTRVEMEFPIT